MRNYDEIIKSFIEGLTEKDYDGSYSEVNKKEGYRIRIIFRGEQLIYQENNRSMICEIYGGGNDGIVFKNTIEEWDNNIAISEKEKELIIQRILLYFKSYQNVTNPRVV